MSNNLSNKMKKSELVDEVERLREKVDALQSELIGLEEAYTELELINYNLANNNVYGIRDLEKLKQQMLKDGMYTEEFWEYLENYLRFYN